MRTNVDVDNELVNECVKLTGLRTKKDIINLALKELVVSRKRQLILEHEGSMRWEGDLRRMREDRK